MPRYCFITGEGSELEEYTEGLVEKLGEENVDIYDDSYGEMLEKHASEYDKFVALGELDEDVESRITEIAEESYVITENDIEGAMKFDIDDSFVKHLYKEIDRLEDRYRSKELIEKIRSFDSIGVLLHDSPDPDAISSGIALEQICDEEGVDVDILYSEEINHQENKAMVNKLDLDLKRVKVDKYFENEEEVYDLSVNGEEFDLDAYEGIALLDTSTTNTKILEPYADEIVPDIVIDHHDGWEKQIKGDFHDVRTERGAVASIMADYFKMLDIEPSETVSTALVHGILSDTLNLDPSSHNFTIDDINNLAFLYKTSDNASLGEIKESSISFETAEILSSAIDYSHQDGTKLYSYVGKVEDTDAIPQAADYLVKLGGIKTVFTYGIQDGDSERIRVSARNNDIKINIGKQLENIFENIDIQGTYGCSAGGSSTKGGASLPLSALGIMSKPIIEDQDIEKFRPAIETTIESFLSRVGSS